MNERIRRHVDELFRDAPKKRRISEMREELMADMNEKYNDLTAEGKSEEEAFESVIAGIGDIGALIDDIGRIDRESFAEAGRDSTRSAALLRALAAGLYIIGIAAAALYGALFGQPELGGIVLLCVFAVATALLVYSFSFVKKKYRREDDTFVEEYKEKISGSGRDARLRGAASSSLWLFIVIAYLLTSFFTGRWDITWVIFLAGVVLQQIISAAFTKKFNIHGIIWSLAVIVYFAVSFRFHNWHISWIIFLIAAALGQVFRFYDAWRDA